MLVFAINYYLSIKLKNIKNSEDKLRDKDIIPVLVLSCNRPAYLYRTLNSLFNVHPFKNNPRFSRLPVFVSNACSDYSSIKILKFFEKKLAAVLIFQSNITVIQNDLDKVEKNRKYNPKSFIAYSKISDHYKHALNWIFAYNFTKHKAVIIFEDDLELSPDIFEYFAALYPLLKKDKSLFCVSAWNDHGKNVHINKTAAEQLYRTDFFPGLGWMMMKSLWLEVRVGWPSTFWDEYMRLKMVVQNRHCIRPEISRTITFGELGSSVSFHYSRYLRYQYLSRLYVKFTDIDLSYLNETNFTKWWLNEILNNSVEVKFESFKLLKTFPKKYE